MKIVTQEINKVRTLQQYFHRLRTLCIFSCYWAGLEKSWNSYLLEGVATVIKCACKFIWRGIAARSMLVEMVCEKGIKLHGKEKMNLEKRLTRSSNLCWWHSSIKPKEVCL